MEITKMLVLSTGHLTGATASYLDSVLELDEDFPVTLCAKGEVGWFVNVPSEIESVSGHHQMPRDLLGVIRFAREQGCDWIMFDRDVTSLDNLPSYSW